MPTLPALAPVVGAEKGPSSGTTQAVRAQASVASPSAAVAGAASSAPASPSGPRIYSVSATPQIVHAGGSISFAAHTSSDIVNVTAFVSAYTLPFTRTSPGLFTLAFSIPANVPGFFHGTYSLNVVARSQHGTSVSRSVPVTFQ